MHQKCTGAQSQLLVLVLNYPILMVDANTAKGDGLAYIIDILVETLVQEMAIIRVILLCHASL
jgi:hypothetical protein